MPTLHVAQGNYAKAEPLFQRSLAIREKALGPDHPDLATPLNNLAELLHRQVINICQALLRLVCRPLFETMLDVFCGVKSGEEFSSHKQWLGWNCI